MCTSYRVGARAPHQTQSVLQFNSNCCRRSWSHAARQTANTTVFCGQRIRRQQQQETGLLIELRYSRVLVVMLDAVAGWNICLELRLLCFVWWISPGCDVFALAVCHFETTG